MELTSTADCIGQWPVSGDEARQSPVLFYSVPDNRKLISIYGSEHPMLVKFFVSNDLLHMGEFLLPAGGKGCRACEPIKHQGDCGLYVEKGPLTVYLTKNQETYCIEEGEMMFLPENTEYQLISYTADGILVIFSIGPGL